MKKGKITQVIGAVLDIRFLGEQVPDIHEAVQIPRTEGAAKDVGSLTAEVAQHMGDGVVRCIAMGSTDGLVRGMEALAMGAPITVPS